MITAITDSLIRIGAERRGSSVNSEHFLLSLKRSFVP